ncbi:hypothetical protein H2203_001284 [Taxawa tesnikishii (nom. ined.)]|nr:hypothetical protein H2203_001284 [Dothideales sp. JES 119]
MSDQRNTWQRTRPSSTNRGGTPASRSATASPNPQSGGPVNVWAERSRNVAQRSSSAANSPSIGSREATSAGNADSWGADGGAGINGPIAVGTGVEKHTSLNGFNADEVRDFLKRGGRGQAYKPAESGQTKAGGAWGSKANHMANGQPFFVQLSKQVAALQAGK